MTVTYEWAISVQNRASEPVVRVVIKFDSGIEGEFRTTRGMRPLSGWLGDFDSDPDFDPGSVTRPGVLLSKSKSLSGSETDSVLPVEYDLSLDGWSISKAIPISTRIL